METNITSYPISESTIKFEYVKQSSLSFQKVGSLENVNENGFISFIIDEKHMNFLFEQFQITNHVNNLRNDYCIVAIKNLIKKNEFLQLSMQLSENLISETEFETEIEENPEKYIIQINRLNHPINLHVISNILTQIGKSFNLDEVSELFSFDTRSINSELKAIDTKFGE
ncbi:MAG: hypothetical protein M0Q53_07430 [Prolixibacteraceae bacterium]|jgi:hypothetical protein|nr:hypothetical protein [Prolixibacteraceae bacterium]